jgi:uncharacterized RmlC-like cupin family protein
MIARSRVCVLTLEPGSDAGPGDFVHVPPHTVHRESNPTNETSVLIAFRSGRGEVVVNVEGPVA